MEHHDFYAVGSIGFSCRLIRLFNGKGEQQITILLPNPFLSRKTDKVLKKPEWSHLELWDALRARWLGLNEPDPKDRSAPRFRHG